MKAIITKDQLKIEDNTLYNSGSIQYYEIDVEFSSDWDGLTKYAVLVGAEKIKLPVVANKLHVDQRASGTYTIGFVGYTLEDDEKVYQISTNLECIYFQTGAGEIEANEPSDLPDPTTWETYLSEIQAIVDGAENVNITAEKVGYTTYITTTDKTGTTETVEVLDGKDAKINGVNTLTVEGGANVSIEQEGSTLIISATDTTDYNELTNKPSINGVELSGNKTSAELNIKQTYNKSDVGLGNVDNIRQYSVNNPPPYPVTSVNGQTGAVVIDTHDDLIPTQASSSNQLADKNFVNSTVGTATSTFRGTYNSLAELEQVTADENDYGFVVGTDTAGNTVYNRYKYASGTWVFEYALNNSSFTAAQWDAIQSGITSGLVTKLQGIEAGAEVNIVEGLKIGNTTQEVENKIIEINPDATPTEGSNNVIDSNAVYEIENMLPTDSASGESVDIDNAQPYKVLDIVADGKYQQGDDPSPSNPQPITQVTSATWNRTNEDNTETQTIPIDLDGNEVCSVGTIKDKLLVDRIGNVALQKNVGKVVLNGSENNWALGTTKTNTQVYELVNAYSNVPKEGNTGLCNRFIINQEGDTEKISFPTNYATLYVAINKSTANTVPEFKTWLSTHNTTVYYALATPQIIPLPKLSILPTTLKGINHIWIDTNLGRTEIEVEYVKDLSLDIPTKTSELTNDSGYVKNTDYATSSVGGVVKIGYGLALTNGQTIAEQIPYSQYILRDNKTFISKGTLENVLTERIGTIETALTTLDVGNGVV